MNKILMLTSLFLILVISLGGVEITYSQTFKYSDNVFNLSEYDLERFETGEPIFSFIETSDDLILTSRLRTRYSFLELENKSKNINRIRFTGYFSPALNTYLSNSGKSSYSFLTGLFTMYQPSSNRNRRYNLNLYYGFYAGNYTRDYRDIDGTGDYESFEYDKNLYRIYSFFNLTDKDLPLLYFQIEDFYHNQYFTEYDGRAVTYGLGWRRNFNDFYMRAFYYYREFDPFNISYKLDNLDLTERISDSAYESDIFYIEMKANRVGVGYTSDIRPFFSYRYEKRHYITDLPLTVAPFHSTREEERHSLNIGCDFLFYRNLDIIFEYDLRMRKTKSDNKDVPKYKDYTKHEFSLTFEYNLRF